MRITYQRWQWRRREIAAKNQRQGAALHTLQPMTMMKMMMANNVLDIFVKPLSKRMFQVST
ncbi:uncharacterized protein LOC120351137 isoform X3 [Nilaparvata lugens]|uniref:uncharacterized protein LOC120351137 isoform X3 n=1 Tax=Nilaparvata lugens TaxID=108931 RepID=UPI00193C96E5|nr:uncharacterized protein LOC120351137 isoform X3 [Nilaparvata lugens]